MLSFKEQNCNITLREGIEEYISYLVANGKEILTELSDSSIVMDHDATHVIFGLDTSLEEESLLDSWVLWCSSFELKYLMSYTIAIVTIVGILLGGGYTYMTVIYAFVFIPALEMLLKAVSYTHLTLPTKA